MTDAAPRYPHADMLSHALAFMRQIADVCMRVEIAGSLRRLKETVKDIEIVAQPRFAGDVNLLNWRCNEMLREKAISLRRKADGSLHAWGERYKALTFDDWPVDLFIVLPDREWGPTFLLRTGPGDANAVLVTQAGVRNRDGNWGILPADMEFKDAALYMKGVKLFTPEERDVYAALSLPHLPPVMRTVAQYQMWAERGRLRPEQLRWARSFIPMAETEPRWTVTPVRQPPTVVVQERLFA